MNKKLDHNKNLVELNHFRYSVYVIAILSIGSWLIIIFNTELEFNWSASGFNNILELFKVPISIMALIIPAVALIASNHRALQTKELIKISVEQNSFTNYYKHFEEFDKYIDVKILKKYNIHLVTRETYKVLFPEALNGILSIDENYINAIDVIFYNLINYIVETCNSDNTLNLQFIDGDADPQDDYVVVLPNDFVFKIDKIFSDVYSELSIPNYLSLNAVLYINEYFEIIKIRATILNLLFKFDHFSTNIESLDLLNNMFLFQEVDVPLILDDDGLLDGIIVIEKCNPFRDL